MPQTTETIELQKNENEVVAAPHPLFENIFNTDASQEINTENAPI